MELLGADFEKELDTRLDGLIENLKAGELIWMRSYCASGLRQPAVLHWQRPYSAQLVSIVMHYFWKPAWMAEAKPQIYDQLTSYFDRHPYRVIYLEPKRDKVIAQILLRLGELQQQINSHSTDAARLEQCLSQEQELKRCAAKLEAVYIIDLRALLEKFERLY